MGNRGTGTGRRFTAGPSRLASRFPIPDSRFPIHSSPMSTDHIRVVLADDHAVVRAGLKAVLGGARDIEVVGEAKTGREAVALVERLKPDVVVMDLTMPDLDGTAATKEIAQKGLSTKVLVLTMHAEDDYLVPLMEAGAAGYLMKNAADRDLVDAI